MKTSTFNQLDTKACIILDRAFELQDIAIDLWDIPMAKRYARICLRIIKYRINLIERLNHHAKL